MSDFLQIRGVIVHHHLLIEKDGVHLIDGGFIGGVRAIGKALKRLGFGYRDIKSILLTHGHLDHTLNLARLKELSGCQIYAPLLDQGHIGGRYSYQGPNPNRICGALEALGRRLLRYRLPEIDHWFQGGDLLPQWGGLEVISLPGHTIGHCGFFQRERGLLFAGDLFSNQFGSAQAPPRFFNDDDEVALASIKVASELPLKGILLNHGRKEAPEETCIDLRILASQI